MRAPLLLSLMISTAAAWGAEEIESGSRSPDGKLAAYECPTARGIGICLLDLARNSSRELINLPGHNRDPVFSPDGLFIAFIAEVSGRQIVTVTDHIGHSWPVADVTGIDGVSWSTDAVWLLFAPQRTDGSSDIYRISAGGTEPRWLTQTPGVSERSPYFSGDDEICYLIKSREQGEQCIRY